MSHQPMLDDRQEPASEQRTGRIIRPHPLVLIVIAMVVGVMVLLNVLTAARGGTPEAATSQVQRAAGGPAIIAVDSRLIGEPDGKQLDVGALAPDFAYTLADGSVHTLSELRGKKVMINFWATWCPPCRAEMPDIQDALNRYGNEGFTVLAVNRNEALNQIQAFADEMGLTLPLITNVAGDISDAYGARGLPISYFINTDGSISFRQIGIMNANFIAQRIEEMQ